MRLICPNCVAQYEVDEDVIPTEGRDVQCANCGHNWFQDSIQMLAIDEDIPSGTGDPDSDVPPELFNDLEGKLDSNFVSTRGMASPNPVDMEPEKPRDDFQIEQRPEPPTPSSRLNPDVLDVLRSEAEYSSGVKPPAAIIKEDTPEQNTDDVAEELPQQTPETESAFVDALDENIDFEAPEEMPLQEIADSEQSTAEINDDLPEIDDLVTSIDQDILDDVVAEEELPTDTDTSDIIHSHETGETTFDASDITNTLNDTLPDVEEPLIANDDLSPELEAVKTTEAVETHDTPVTFDEKIFETLEANTNLDDAQSEPHTETVETHDVISEIENESTNLDNDEDTPIETPPPVDDLDEIRKRIAELQAADDNSLSTSPEEHSDVVAAIDDIENPSTETTDQDFDADVDVDVDVDVDAGAIKPDQKRDAIDDSVDENPFSRPSHNIPKTERPISVPRDSAYQEIIPIEGDASNKITPEEPSTDTIQQMVTDQIGTPISPAESEIIASHPEQPSIKDAIDDLANQDDADGFRAEQVSQPEETPYVPNDHSELRKDMFQDVDEISTEIANEADLNSSRSIRSGASTANTLVSILRGFIFALILCIIIGALYLFQPIIVEYIPQTEGVMNMITGLVNFAKNIFGPLFGR